MLLNGIHHITAVTGDAAQNVAFYSATLGMRLVKKTVNQDDVHAYHLYYGDTLGSPGTAITFFDWPHLPPNRPGADSIAAMVLRVPSPESVAFWAERLAAKGVVLAGQGEIDGQPVLWFDDPDGQRIWVVADDGAPFDGDPWVPADVPAAHVFRGAAGVVLNLPSRAVANDIVSGVLGYQHLRTVPDPSLPGNTLKVYASGDGAPGRILYVRHVAKLPARLGPGGTHHVAFRVADAAEQDAWRARLIAAGIGTSEAIDRFYFRSIYFRISAGILFEIATDGPGFAVDEPAATLGERLALPPFLEPHRRQIEVGLKPIQ
jgi:glyoxalase family protein